MSLRALFLGVDRHADPAVPELTGARRDATLLYALFRDTLPDAEVLLWLDEDVIARSVTERMIQLLGTATDADTVVISFSGHGTHDHRLVCFDTRDDAMDESTVSMDTLARLFRESHARNIILILDCCFSGGARAKVLAESLIPRALRHPVQELGGRGRFLITASASNEEAYELPRERHGLLTYYLAKGLVGELSSPTVEPVISLPTLVDQVAGVVRAEAQKIGGHQTPTYIGEIEGGFTLPIFRRGEEYTRAFPERVRRRVSAEIADLEAYGLPRNILEGWISDFPDGLNDLQVRAVNDFGILTGEHVIVIAPTSSGKTFIGEIAAIRAIEERRKALFLLPYKALVNEKFDQFIARYAELGIRIIRSTGDFADQNSELMRGQYDICFMTYEMCLQMLLANNHILDRVGLVVVDEIQFLTDENRGINLELLLTFLVYQRQHDIEPQLVLLSAVVGGINELDRWLNATLLHTDRRPVPLFEGAIDRSGAYEYWDPQHGWQAEQYLSPMVIRQRRAQPSSQDLIVPLVQKLVVGTTEKVIVFRNQRGRAQGCATYLADELGLPPVSEALSELPGGDLSDASQLLRHCLQRGTAFHNTNLSPAEKLIVERHFRNPTSPLRVVVATSTLAAGINTPASTVIIVEREFAGDDGPIPYTVAQYKNMAGRAGRLGFREIGKAICTSEGSYERDQIKRTYIMGQLEPFRSTFDTQDLTTLIIRLLAQIPRLQRSELPLLLASTYGGYLNTRVNPNWAAQITGQVEERVDWLKSRGLLEEDDNGLSLTLLGRVCGEVGLEITSALRIIDALRRVGHTRVTPEWVVTLLQASKELDEVYTPINRRGRREMQWPSELSRQVGSDAVFLLQEGVAGDEFLYSARCKRALIVLAWSNGVVIDRIERSFTLNPFAPVRLGDVRAIVDRTRMFVPSVHRLATIVYPEGTPLDTAIDDFLEQMEYGIPRPALPLLNLRVPLERGQLLALSAVGLTTAAALQADETRLRAIVGSRNATLLLDAARRYLANP